MGWDVAAHATTVVKVAKQTLSELKEENEQYINWLLETYGQPARDYFLKYLQVQLNLIPKDGTEIELPLVKLGTGTISFYPYTVEVKFGPIKDPINLIFHSNGSARDIKNILFQKTKPNWYSGFPARVQYAFISDTGHGGKDEWVRMTDTFSDRIPPVSLASRKHMRIFESSTGCMHNPGFDKYSIGAVHEDAWNSHFGPPVDKSQVFVEKQFSSLGYNSTTWQLQPQGEIVNGVQHDGLASCIEISGAHPSPIITLTRP